MNTLLRFRSCGACGRKFATTNTYTSRFRSYPGAPLMAMDCTVCPRGNCGAINGGTPRLA